jgi:hypothetical protein
MLEMDSVTGPAEVKVDLENRCLLKDSEPFFPHGIWSGHLDDGWLGLYRDIGFNTILLWQGPGRGHDPMMAWEELDRLHDHGLMAVPRPLAYVRLEDKGLIRRDNRAMITASQAMREPLITIRNHPAVLVYYGMDEAPDTQLDAGLREFLNVCRQVDPYHPVYLGCSTPAEMNNYAYADILGRHTYWCPLGCVPHRTPNRPARVVRWNVDTITEPAHRPFFYCPQSEYTSHSRRALTHEERKITVYLGVINGAKSCLYFRAPIVHRATVTSMKEIASEIHALAPALLKRRPVQRIDVDPKPSHELDQPQQRTPCYDLPIVQSAFVDHPDAGLLLIAGNSNVESVSAHWDLSALGNVAVSDFFGKKTYAVDGSQFTDEFAGYGLRVYRIQAARRKPDVPLTASVELEGPALANAAGQAYIEVEQPSGKNAIINSSFEEAALSGWPDSWWIAYPMPDRMAGDEGEFGMDDSYAYDGKYSMKMVNPYAGPSPMPTLTYRHYFPNLYLRGGIPVKKGKKYVFSAYIRAEKAGSPVSITICNYAYNGMRHNEGVTKQFPLTTEWKRYEVVVIYPEQGWHQGHRPELAIQLNYRGPGNTAMWIDAVQFEEGDTPTEYTR